MSSTPSPVHADLARAAQAGDDQAFLLLIRDHMPGLRAVAIAMLGYVDEAEDVVQDAVLTALRKLPGLADTAAVGPWLRAIVRNNCRLLLRSRRVVPVAEPALLLPADPCPGPEELMDRAMARDWVRRAVTALPEPAREVTMLRYFTEFSSYRRIAEVCGISENTVRSRLRAGRRALAQILAETPGDGYERAPATDCRAEAEESIAAGLRGDYPRMVRDRFHTDATLSVEGRLYGDRMSVATAMTDTLAAGVRLRLYGAVVSGDVMIWETEFLNPPGDPDHCPPAMAWLYTLRQGRFRRLRIAYRREPLA